MPAPRKRSEELARPRDRKGATPTTMDVSHGELREVRVPNGDRNWHAIAKKMYDALRTSGQADFYQNSDWATAYFLCNEISEYLKAPRRSAQQLTALLAGWDKLMPTEAERRRARIELQKAEEEQEPVELTVISDYQQMLAGGAS